MATPRIRIEFSDAGALRQEFERNLQNGGTFVRVAGGVAEGDECEIALIHPRGASMVLRARAVWLDPGVGVGVAFIDFSAAVRDELGAFVASDPAGTASPDPGAPPSPSVRPERSGEAAASKSPARASVSGRIAASEVHVRLRGLSVADQLKVARGPDANARIVLERIYGKTVWDPILRNPRVTMPEVIRISRMHSLPQPLVELVCANAAWLKSPQVRRALLANPRLPLDLAGKVLRAVPRHELRLIPQQTAYSSMVREAARRLLGL
jgi:hypothetical protein